MRTLLPRVLCITLLGVCLVGCEAEKTSKPTEIYEEPQNGAFIQTARKELGTEEHPRGSNRGERVDTYNLTCGKEFIGAPWCASFTRWCFYQIGRKDVPGAYSPDWYKKERVIESNNAKPSDQALIYFHSLGRYAHTIACITEVSKIGNHAQEITTVEANSNPEGGREGYGVFRRVRAADSVTIVRWLP